MKSVIVEQKHHRAPMILISLAAPLLLLLGIIIVSGVSAGEQLDEAGYLDFYYGTAGPADITGEKPESKLWWNDGFWWGSLYNLAAGEYRIYRLNWGTQTWEDTGVALDDREESKADVLWDADSNKLYVVSHLATKNSGKPGGSENWGRLYRFTYDETGQTYSLDGGFPVTVNEDITEALALAHDSTGRLWVTYVSRPVAPSTDYQVYVNASTGSSLNNDDNWGIPFTLPFPEAHVAQDDIAAIVSFRDDGGNKIGVMWSNQLSNTINFATHLDSNTNAASGWSLTTVPIPVENPADDHVSVKSLQTASSGQVFAAIKTSTITPTESLVGLVARDTNGAFSFHEYSNKTQNDTNPMLVIDEDSDTVYIFVTGKPGGSMICYKAATITIPLANMNFPAGNCGTHFIESTTYTNIDNATTSKHNVNSTTGLVVLASNFDPLAPDLNYYVHNVLGDPPPVVTARGPNPNAANVPAATVITATFSKPINTTTLTSSNFEVEDSSGPVAGTITYNNATRTATFTPDAPLKVDTLHTVTIGSGVLDTTGNFLYGAPEQWSFTTESAVVHFGAAAYSVHEDDGTAVITVTLNGPSSQSIEIDYATSDGTATEGTDYTATSGTLTFPPGMTSQSFSVTIIEDNTSEPSETINLTLSDPVNAILGIPNNIVLTIMPSVQTSYLPIILTNP